VSVCTVKIKPCLKTPSKVLKITSLKLLVKEFSLTQLEFLLSWTVLKRSITLWWTISKRYRGKAPCFWAKIILNHILKRILRRKSIMKVDKMVKLSREIWMISYSILLRSKIDRIVAFLQSSITIKSLKSWRRSLFLFVKSSIRLHLFMTNCRLLFRAIYSIL
jgi:hypothetical protein